MIKIAVCDDDEKNLRDTLKLLEQYKKFPLSADAYTSGEALLAAGKKYDILLLDIDMEGLDGIETARRIREADKEVKLIYVTNYSDYTIFAFGVHAFAYLLKPLRAEELFAQLDEAFHSAIVAGSGNYLLIAINQQVNLGMKTFRAKTFQVAQNIRNAVEPHTRIMEAIQARDGAGAEREMRVHLDKVEEDLSENVNNPA